MSSNAHRERLMQVLLGPHVSEKATSLAEAWSEPNVPNPIAGMDAPVYSLLCGTRAGSTRFSISFPYGYYQFTNEAK